jgi:hypothetical protein
VDSSIIVIPFPYIPSRRAESSNVLNSNDPSMKAHPRRRYVLLAIVVIVAVLTIGSIAFFTISPNNETSPATTGGSTVVTSSCVSTPTLHCVIFQQLGACSPEFWGVPWSVTIGGITGVQPPGTPLPLGNDSLGGTMNSNFTTIAFLLPDGSYHFRVSPSNDFFTPDSGTVIVNGAGSSVQIKYTGTSCTATATSS